jgi:hypothetical protein
LTRQKNKGNGVKKSLFGLAKSEDQAVSIVHQLTGAGFSDDDISVLLPDKMGGRHFAHVSARGRLKEPQPGQVSA